MLPKQLPRCVPLRRAGFRQDHDVFKARSVLYQLLQGMYIEIESRGRTYGIRKETDGVWRVTFRVDTMKSWSSAEYVDVVCQIEERLTRQNSKEGLAGLKAFMGCVKYMQSEWRA